jgi:DMSO reductase anchor subunit
MAIETNTLVVGWNRAVSGREAAAGELFGATVGYYEKQVKAGKLTGWEPMFLTAHGGDFNGMFILRGTGANLDAIRQDEEFVELILRAQHCLENVGVIAAYSGMNVIQDMMMRWTKQIPR